MSVLTLDQASRWYGNVVAVNGISMTVRPGITGLWQVSGRNNLSFDQWMQLDLQYIDGWSLLLDFEILRLGCAICVN